MKRVCRFEQMEPRQLLSAAPIQIGAVYFEDSIGADTAGDVFEVTWSGGAAGTQLASLTIETDKLGDGIDAVDTFFDTESGGLGVSGWAGLTILDSAGINLADATVADGGTTLVMSFTGFDPGEKLRFSIDVDEKGFLHDNPVAEGAEFEGSQLLATFTAPHYHDSSGMDLFLDAYDHKLGPSGLDLPPDDYVPPLDVSHVDQTAGAVFSLTQTPLPIRIAGTVYEDADRDNTQDPADVGIAGVTLGLYRYQGSGYADTGQTAVTDADGHYRFDDLLPGTYRIVQSQPSGYLSVGATAGSVDGHGRGVVESENVITQIELLGGDDSVGNDFAETLPAALSGYVYHDRDNDGLRQPGEEGIAGAEVRVQYLPPAGPLPAPIVVYSGADGAWSVDGLTPGEYRVEEVTPAGYFDGLDAAGTAGGTAQNPGDSITAIQLAGGQAGQEYDFGEIRPASIAGRVIADRDGDCLFSPGDVLLAGVTLRLRDAQGNLLATTLTDQNGEYRFDGLTPGMYRVEEVQPEGYFDGGDHVGSAGGTLLDPDSIIDVALVSDASGSGYDFCELEPAALSGFVYADDNDNGLREPGEAPLAGVSLALLDQAGQPTGVTATTDAAGFYRFEGLRPGRVYGVAEAQPDGYFDGKDTPGTAGGTAQNPGDRITDVLLAAAVHGENYNFGELRPVSIGGRVHAELNGDCIPDPGEPLLAGVTIYLLDASGSRIASATTDAQGMYRFEGLAPGTYGVEEVQPEGYLQGQTHVGSEGGHLAGPDRIEDARLASGVDAVDYNFCEMVPATISGYVFQDGPTIQLDNGQDVPRLTTLRDGRRTADDQPIAGVRLQLGDGSGAPILAADGQPITTVTDAHGHYAFTGLAPGVYTIIEVQPEDYLDGIDTPGSKGGLAVNPDANIDPVVLSQLVVNPNDDAILLIPIAMGDDASSYNFSEVRVEEMPPVVPPPLPRPPTDPLPPPTTPILPPDPVTSLAYVPSPMQRTVMPRWDGGGVVLPFTWHLSVIDGGRPRSQRHDPQQMVSFQALYFDPQTWTGAGVDGGQWTIADGEGNTQHEFTFGIPGGIPLAGDFNGDGVDEIAVFLDGVWFIDLNGNGVWDSGDLWARLGRHGDQPVAGDWDADGKTDIAIFGPAWRGDERAIEHEPGLPDADNIDAPRFRRVAKNLPPQAQVAATRLRTMKRTAQGPIRNDLIDHVFQYGSPGDVPVAGDWNGDGVVNIGLFRQGTWYLDGDGDGRWSAGDSLVEHFGTPGDVPVVGDFNGDGIDDLGVYHEGTWHLDTNGDRRLDAHDRVLQLGGPHDKPVVGDFDGDGIDQPAVYRGGTPQADPASTAQVEPAP